MAHRSELIPYYGVLNKSDNQFGQKGNEGSSRFDRKLHVQRQELQCK